MRRIQSLSSFDRSWRERSVPASWRHQRLREEAEQWKDGPNRLALKLDSDTNNTSLVMALELGKGGPFLLLPGDAQVGSWRSWHELKFKAGGLKSEIGVRDIFRRTILYKVGHHASPNATLRELGLELMTDEDLVAMIPVEVAMARKRNGTCPIPLLTSV
jgi:hypothetical protein